MSAYTSVSVGSKRIIICGGNLNLGVSPFDDFSAQSEGETYIYTQSCVLAGDVKARDLHLHTGSFQTVGVPTINVSGETGGDASSSSKKLRTGGDGKKGHSFYFSSADFDYKSRFKVNASGGDGGRGYFDATGQGGGSGGDGGSGGIVNIMYEDSYQRAMDGYSGYEYALSKEDPEHPEDTERMIKQAAKDFVNVIHILVEADREYNKEVIAAMADLYEQLNKTDKHGSPDITISLKDLKADMAALRNILEYQKPGEGMLADLRSVAAIHGGFPGRGNNYEDRPDRYGGSGIYGNKGEHWGYCFMDYGMIWDRDIFLYHPDQMALALRGAYVEYFKGAGGRDAKGIKDCAAILGQIINRLGFLSEIDPKNPTNKSDSSLWKTFKRNESAMQVLPSTSSDDIPSSIKSLQSTYTQAMAYMVQLGTGQDIYGHSSLWVPVGSYNYYQDQTKKALEYFKDMEANYQAYMKRNKDQNITEADAQTAIADAGRAKAKIERHQIKMKELIQDLIPSIDRLNEQVAPKKKLVLESIKEVESKINDSFVVPIKEFLESAVSFCFMPKSKLMGAAVSAQMIWSLLEGQTSIEDDAGDVVKKGYLINRLQEMDGSIESLKDGIALTNAGTFEPGDAGGPKLVAEKEKLTGLINRYKGLITDWSKIEEQFDDYIDTVTARNNRALQYNQYLASWWHDQLDIKQVQDDIERLQKKRLDQLDPNLAAVTSFVQLSYHAAVDRIFKVLYMTERAQLFWTLGEPLDKFDSIRKGGIDGGSLHTELETLSKLILEAYNTALESTTSAYQKFGDWGETDGANTPLLYTLSAAELKHFQDGEEQTSVNMANTWAQKSKDRNIFLGKCDVRLTKVRCFIEGNDDFDRHMKDKTISVVLRHPGMETIVDQNKHPHRFDHNPRKFTFEYTHPFDRKTPRITTDGTMYDSPDAKAWEYARGGPFTTWNIILGKAGNPDLTMEYRKKITKATMEFTGWAKTA